MAAEVGGEYRFHDVTNEAQWIELIADVVAIQRRMIAELVEAGCRYVQIDETAFAKFGDPEVQASLNARGA